jgi:murein DD-endopeptidase MepM/ murein hydrolase activator NlpD
MRYSFTGRHARRTVRWGVLSVAAVGAAGCSPDTARFDNPFGSPYASQPTAGQVSPASARQPAVASVERQPLPPQYDQSQYGQPQYAPPSPPAPYQQPQAAPLQYTTPPAQGALPPLSPPRAPDVTGALRPNTVSADGNWDWEGGTAIVVVPGETIDAIARKHHVPARAIIEANNIANAAVIVPGQRLVIPRYKVHGAGAKLAHATAPRVPAVTPTASSPAPATAAMPIAPTLRAPAPPVVATATPPRVPATLVVTAASPPRATAAPVVATAPTPVPSAAASQPASAPIGSAQTLLPAPPVHTVSSGETLGSIAHKYHVKTNEIMVANGLGGDTSLKIGMKLTIPVKMVPAKGRAVAGAPGGAPAAPAGVTSAVAATKLSPTHGAPPIGKTASTEQTTGARVAAEAAPEETGAANSNSLAPAFRWPLRGRVVNNFGAKVNGSANDGIDLAVPEGTPVRAAEDGVVAYAGNELKGYGNLVLVRHANGFVTAYANASEVMVKRNDQVHKGQVIAKTGQTGSATAPQLHFEVRKNSSPVDPIQFLPADKTASAPL